METDEPPPIVPSCNGESIADSTSDDDVAQSQPEGFLNSSVCTNLETTIGDQEFENGGFYGEPSTDSLDFNPNDLEQEVMYLRDRNHQLEEQMRLFQQFLSLDNYLPDDLDNPVALVIVPDNPRARYYKDMLEEFLSNLPPIKESKLRRNKKADEYDPAYQPSSFNLYNLLSSTDPRNANKVKMIYNSFVAHSDYLVDACGQPLVQFDANLTDGWVIPSFSQSWHTSVGDDEAPTKTKKFQMSCFNCGGAHNLKECTEKRDLVRISQNRQALINKFGAAPGLAAKSTRYHMETSQVDKRYAKFQPGVISSELRDALKVHRRSLPMFSYRMRYLGYPPGWLKEAEVESSGLDIIQGNPEISEDGEVIMDLQPGTKIEEVTYNMDKLVSFPGFNSKLPDGVHEECNKMRPAMPPMQKHQQLSVWCVFLASGDKRPATVADFDDLGEPPAKKLNDSVDIAPADMDITENEPVMPIIQGDESPVPEYAPPPLPIEPLETIVPVFEDMPPPVMFRRWWTKCLYRFISPEDFKDDSVVSDNDQDLTGMATEDLDDRATVTTIEDTVRSLRSSETKAIIDLTATSSESETENIIAVVKVLPFKPSNEMLENVEAFRNSVRHLNLSQVIFPDKACPESLENLDQMESLHVEFIKDGEEKFVSMKGLPEYWKFSSGIEPYEAIEELPTLGLYSKIIQTLKQHGRWK